MFDNPALWSSVGFWILMVGLVGDLILIFVPSGRTEKILATLFTLLITAGVFIEHKADSEQFTPRNLSTEQQRLLVDKLKPFAGQTIKFVVKYMNDEETSHIARQLLEVLGRAGWPSDSFLTHRDDEYVTRGITVGFDESASPSAQEAVRALVLALREVQLKVTDLSPSDIRSFGLREVAEPVRIIVGKK
jgi:hypothetical protein